MADKDALALLSSVPLFEGLEKKELKHILSAAKEVEFAAGHTVVSQGESGAAFHLIVDGTAEVSINGETKARLHPGDYFGEMSLIDHGPRSATVTATSPLKTLSLVSWSFLPLLDEMPSIARKMLIQLSHRLRAVEQSHIH